MPQQAWSNKRERQYEHIKESAKDRGASTKQGEGDRGAHGQQGARSVRRGARRRRGVSCRTCRPAAAAA